MQGYVRLDDTFCSPLYSTYTTFDEAKEACSTDIDCKMFVDVYKHPNGRKYVLCKGLSAKKLNVSCDSVVYEKEGK